MEPSHPRRGVSPNHRASGIALPAWVAVAAAVALAAVLPSVGFAASPSAPPVDPFPTVETRLDGPVADPAVTPPDARNVLVAATLWDVRNQRLFAINGLVMKLYPASGKAKPTTATTTSDWPGHLTAILPIPKGGAGRVEIVTEGNVCTHGACHAEDIPLRIAGTGPPPDAPLSALIRAELVPAGRNAVAGAPARVSVHLAPIGLWSSDELKLPPSIVLVASLPGVPDLARAELALSDPNGIYTGSLVVPRPGEVTLRAGLPTAGGVIQPIEGDLGTLLVGGTAVAGSSARPAPSPGTAEPPAPPSGSEDAGPPWVVIGAIVVLVLGLALFLGDPLTRRFRGRPGRDRDAR